jgi:gas vesicle protein
MSERMYYSREAEMQALRERFVLAIVVAALGLGMGAVLALLFAPQSGDKTRQQLGEEVERVTSQGREAAKQASHNLGDKVQKIRDNVEDRIAR